MTKSLWHTKLIHSYDWLDLAYTYKIIGCLCWSMIHINDMHIIVFDPKFISRFFLNLTSMCDHQIRGFFTDLYSITCINQLILEMNFYSYSESIMYPSQSAITLNTYVSSYRLFKKNWNTCNAALIAIHILEFELYWQWTLSTQLSIFYHLT